MSPASYPYHFDHQKPYRPLSQHYQALFHQKVFKVSVSVATTCPNREGQGGKKVCIFCDEWGSAAYHTTTHHTLSQQIQINSEAIRKRYNAKKFLIYFQSYTNTFGKMEALEAMYQSALTHPDVLGLVIGTRPDCLSRRVLKTFETILDTHFLSIELGVQTLVDSQLQFLSRGHTRACSIGAIQKLRSLKTLHSYTSSERLVDICVHLIFGIPGETDEQLQETAKLLSELQVDGVKIHNLHVLKNTPLETLYRQDQFKPVDLEEYARKVAIFLEHLSPNIAIHRLAAVASRWDELVAPDWTKEKMRPTQFIEDFLKSHQIWQGKAY